MEKDTVDIIGTGVLNHYKKGVPYTVTKKRLSSIPKKSYTFAEPAIVGTQPKVVAVVKSMPTPTGKPAD